MIVYSFSHNNIFCVFCSFLGRSYDLISNLFKRKCFVCHFVLMVIWSSISVSLILMELVSALVLSRFFEINLQHLLWFVSVFCFVPESSSSLVNFVFFIFIHLLWRFYYLCHCGVSVPLWDPCFVSAFHCDFPSLWASWIKM